MKFLPEEQLLKNAIFGDFHLHSRFSRACSKDITFDNLVKWAKIKGLNLLGTGDFTHPVWFEEIKKMKPNNKGFYFHKGFPFIITGEISLIYTQGRGRRVHLNLLIPNIEIAERIHAYLDTKGRRDYDGRPIFKISCKQFTKDLMDISKDIEIIPAHIWTPWFGVFGAMSGFDSLKEAFGEQFENIHAIETGISSDPEMNWRIAELEDKAIVSFSDAHSFWPFRLGREATIFRKTDSYKDLINQIREKSFIGTIETDPAYGKYHWDGHRNCGFSCSPEQAKKLNNICPVCHKPLIIGVEHRVEELTTNPKDFLPKNAKPYFEILPLHELLSVFLNVSMQSKRVWAMYNSLIEKFENELNLLLKVPEQKLREKGVDSELVDLIIRNRNHAIKVSPGFDGQYGKIIISKQSILV